MQSATIHTSLVVWCNTNGKIIKRIQGVEVKDSRIYPHRTHNPYHMRSFVPVIYLAFSVSVSCVSAPAFRCY